MWYAVWLLVIMSGPLGEERIDAAFKSYTGCVLAQRLWTHEYWKGEPVLTECRADWEYAPVRNDSWLH